MSIQFSSVKYLVCMATGEVQVLTHTGWEYLGYVDVDGDIEAQVLEL